MLHDATTVQIKIVMIIVVMEIMMKKKIVVPWTLKVIAQCAQVNVIT
jgi:hypothetical protein